MRQSPLFSGITRYITSPPTGSIRQRGLLGQSLHERQGNAHGQAQRGLVFARQRFQQFCQMVVLGLVQLSP